jgi:hypothetical protein
MMIPGVIPENFLPNQLDRNPAGPEACGLYTMRRGFQWAVYQV